MKVILFILIMVTLLSLFFVLSTFHTTKIIKKNMDEASCKFTQDGIKYIPRSYAIQITDGTWYPVSEKQFLSYHIGTKCFNHKEIIFCE